MAFLNASSHRGPLEVLVTLEKLNEWLEDRAQVSDKLAVIIDHSKEGSQLGEVLKAWCLFDGFYLFLCRRNSAGRDDTAHVRY